MCAGLFVDKPLNVNSSEVAASAAHPVPLPSFSASQWRTAERTDMEAKGLPVERSLMDTTLMGFSFTLDLYCPEDL